MTSTLCSFIVLLIAAVKDLRDRIIPNWMSILIASLSIFLPEGPVLVGALVAVPLFMAGLLWGGIGGGDIKLIAVMGLYLGMDASLFAMLISCIMGLIFVLIRTGIHPNIEDHFPFGPSIAVSIWIILMYGDFLIK